MPEPITATVITVGTLAASIGDFIDFLFGGGHAGSCGEFREAFFDTFNAVLPVAEQLQTALVQFGNFQRNDLEVILGAFVTTSVSIYDSLNQGWEQFRGANLLGQTMYGARTINMWLRVAHIVAIWQGQTGLFKRMNQGFAVASQADAALQHQISVLADVLSQLAGGGSLDQPTDLSGIQNALDAQRQEYINLHNAQQAPFNALKAQVEQEVKPMLGKNQQAVGDLTNWVIANLVPPIQLFNSFIIRFPERFQAEIARNCALIRECVGDSPDEPSGDECERGRSFWGLWAECWLEANTPDPTLQLTFDPNLIDPREVPVFLIEAVSEEPPNRAAVLLADVYSYLSQVTDTDAPDYVPLHTFSDDAQFIFTEPTV